MSAPRLVLLALAALLATGGAFWLSSQRHLPREVRTGDAVMPQLRPALNDVTEVHLSRGDGAAVTLRRTPQGWVVAERSWRADAGKVRKLLLDLAALAVVEEKTHDPARYPVLGVEDVKGPTATGTRIDLRTAKGAIHSLIVGKPAGTREGYVRAVGAQPSYLARPLLAVETQPGRWLDTALVDLDAAQLRAVTVEGTGRAPKTYEGDTLPPALSGALKALTLDDVRARPLETAEARAPHRARFVTWDGLVIDIAGREDGPRPWISVNAHVDPAAIRPRPASVAPAATLAPAQAEYIAQRLAGHEFEVPVYRFSSLFDLPPSP